MNPAAPYAPPRADLDQPPAAQGAALAGRLFSIRQIAVGTFFGGPLAGTLMMAENYRVNGRRDSARKAVIAGIVVSLAVAALALVLPDRVPNSALPLVYVLSLHSAAKTMQGSWVGVHLATGGARQSNWRVAGLSLAGLALLLGLMVAAVLVTGAGEG